MNGIGKYFGTDALSSFQKSFPSLQIKTKTQSTEQDDECSRKNNLICENGEISFNKDIANYFDSLNNGEDEGNGKLLDKLSQNSINFNSTSQQAGNRPRRRPPAPTRTHEMGLAPSCAGSSIRLVCLRVRGCLIFRNR